MTPPTIRIKPTAPLIFIAEDDPMILELAVIGLEQAGFRTRYATDGWAAWDGIKASCPDAVLLDINMGGMDGLAVLRTLRAHPPTKAIPVLMMTARGGPEDVVEAIRLGAMDYLAKPFEMRVLLQRVGRLVAASCSSGLASTSLERGAEEAPVLLG